jgi:hypothetical protein
MTTTPNFDDLTPPDEVYHEAAIDNGWRGAATAAYRAGARHGWEQARQLWPEPITDRRPTEADADERGNVQYLGNGTWQAADWEVAASHAWPWTHTPRWQPRQPSPVDTLAAIIREVDGDHRLGAGALAEAILAHPDARRALEQAGEGQA